jgi:hypothetical protein
MSNGSVLREGSKVSVLFCQPMGACYKPGAFARPDRRGARFGHFNPGSESRFPSQIGSLPPAGVAELVDALDLGSSDESCGGSNPSARTTPQMGHRKTSR